MAIKLTADRTEISADGEDVSVLRVEVLDKEGRAIPTATNMISFRVTGEGALIGVGNGDPNCQESDKDPKRSLFNGLAQVIVQSTRTPGTITVEAYTEPYPRPKLPSVKVTIATKKVELRAGRKQAVWWKACISVNFRLLIDRCHEPQISRAGHKEQLIQAPVLGLSAFNRAQISIPAAISRADPRKSNTWSRPTHQTLLNRYP